MAALHLLSLSTSFSISSSSHHTLSPSSIAPSNSFAKKSVYLNQKLFNGPENHKPAIVKERFSVIVKVSSPGADSLPPSENEEENKSVAVENLPLESKIQSHADQTLKMRLARKIRLKRKRLVKKRHLRKKGRWPPSKMKAHKNV